MYNKTICILVAVVCIVLVYQFIVRPLQQDAALKKCLNYAEYSTPLSGDYTAGMSAYEVAREGCFRHYK